VRVRKDSEFFNIANPSRDDTNVAIFSLFLSSARERRITRRASGNAFREIDAVRRQPVKKITTNLSNPSLHQLRTSSPVMDSRAVPLSDG